MSKKPNLYLVSNVAIKKKYDMFYVFMCDGSIFEYKLGEVKISLVDEWVEVERIDKTVMESFVSGNIMRVKFMKSTAKLVEIEISPPVLKPVA
jgi:hypothetical protein